MTDRWWIPGYKRREAGRQLALRIERLESWHKIFNEWAAKGDWDVAAEMANQGLTFVAWILKQYYLPQIREQLNTKAILAGIIGDS